MYVYNGLILVTYIGLWFDNKILTVGPSGPATPGSPLGPTNPGWPIGPLSPKILYCCTKLNSKLDLWIYNVFIIKKNQCIDVWVLPENPRSPLAPGSPDFPIGPCWPNNNISFA